MDPSAPLLYEVLNRGDVIGGSSAGAAIQTAYLVRGSPNFDQNNKFEGYELGFNFLPGVAVDQHLTQRKRFGVMTKLMQALPQFLGIGIDEYTAMIVKGQIADVMGKGSINDYDTTKPVEMGKPDYFIIPSGGRLDLKSRQVLPVPGKGGDKTPFPIGDAAKRDALYTPRVSVGRGLKNQHVVQMTNFHGVSAFHFRARKPVQPPWLSLRATARPDPLVN
jgi:hypothetical protein